MQKVNVFDWNKAFAEIFKNGGFDCVIGNPPWGANFSQNEKDYIAQYYKSFLGNFDSYLFFIEKSINLIKREGVFSFITPDTWIKIPQSKKLREIILEIFDIKNIIILPLNIFKNVSANCIIFILNKIKINPACLVGFIKSDLKKLSENEFDNSFSVDYNLWKKDIDLQFQIFQTDNIYKIINKIKSVSCPAIDNLDDFMLIWHKKVISRYILLNLKCRIICQRKEIYYEYIQ
jgi:hypothetical protein